MENTYDKIWDVAVIGGGPAGMMSAGRAAERDAKVILLEKNDSLGKKLLITGGGRSNITNAEFDNRKFLEKLKDDAKYLHSPFSVWNAKSTIDFFNKRNMETTVEAYQRVFPTSNKAQSVWDVLSSYMSENNVTVLSNSEVKGFIHDKGKILSARISGNKLIHAKQFILATGGKSHPETGSTGDGFKWLKELGHNIVEPKASLVPIAIRDAWVRNLQGLTLENVKLTIFQNGKKHGSSKGRILFTHFGISGPTVINMSRDVGEFLRYGDVILSLDLLPALDYSKLNSELQRILTEHSNKQIKNSLGTLIAPSLVHDILTMAKIDPNTWSHSVTREERLLLVKLLKDIPLHVEDLLGVEDAIITSGGARLDEVDWKTMKSAIIKNLFLVGDILNINRPSGGYSLQLCWTTGFVAGNSVEI